MQGRSCCFIVSTPVKNAILSWLLIQIQEQLDEKAREYELLLTKYNNLNLESVEKGDTIEDLKNQLNQTHIVKKNFGLAKKRQL